MPNTFQNGLKGLLDTGMLGDIGTGLLANSGYSATPTSFGQAFGGAMAYGNQRQGERVQLAAQREQIKQQQAQSAARSQLQSLLTPTQTPGPVVSQIPAAINTPEGQAQIPGLLAQLAPEQMAASLMPKPEEKPRVSTAMNDFQMMNPQLQPGTPEFSAGFKQFALDQDPTGALSAQVALQLQSMQLEELRRTRDAEERTTAQSRRGMVVDTARDLSKLKEMANLNQRLEGTALASGQPMPELRRAVAGGVSAIQSLLGMDTREAQQLMADFDRMSKLNNDFVITSIDRFADSGSVSVPKFNALMQANASMSASPIANNQIIADNIAAILDAAEIEGIEVPNAKELRDLYKSLKATSSANAQAFDVNTAPIAELDSMDISQFTPEQMRTYYQRKETER